MKDFFLNHLNVLGLTLNLAGTLLVACFIGKDRNECVEGEGKPGEKWHSLLIYHPYWFKSGIILIIIGFFLSLVDSLLK